MITGSPTENRNGTEIIAASAGIARAVLQMECKGCRPPACDGYTEIHTHMRIHTSHRIRAVFIAGAAADSRVSVDNTVIVVRLRMNRNA